MKLIPYRFPKKYCGIWIAVDRNGKRFLHYEVGSAIPEQDESF